MFGVLDIMSRFPDNVFVKLTENSYPDLLGLVEVRVVCDAWHSELSCCSHYQRVSHGNLRLVAYSRSFLGDLRVNINNAELFLDYVRS